jgi:hypothetical protein
MQELFGIFTNQYIKVESGKLKVELISMNCCGKVELLTGYAK